MRSILLLLSFLVGLVGFGQQIVVSEYNGTSLVTSGQLYTVTKDVTAPNKINIQFAQGIGSTGRFGFVASYKPLNTGASNANVALTTITCLAKYEGTSPSVLSSGANFLLSEYASTTDPTFSVSSSATSLLLGASGSVNKLVATSVVYIYAYNRVASSGTYLISNKYVKVELPPEDITDDINNDIVIQKKICPNSTIESFFANPQDFSMPFPRSYSWNGNTTTCKLYQFDGSAYTESTLNELLTTASYTFTQKRNETTYSTFTPSSPTVLVSNQSYAANSAYSGENSDVIITGEYMLPSIVSQPPVVKYLSHDAGTELQSVVAGDMYFLEWFSSLDNTSTTLNDDVSQGQTISYITNSPTSLPNNLELSPFGVAINDSLNYYFKIYSWCDEVITSDMAKVIRLPAPDATGYDNQTVCTGVQINQLSNPGTQVIGGKSYSWAFFPTDTEIIPFVGSDIAQTTTYYVRYKLVENGNTYYSDNFATISVTVLDPFAGAISGAQSICMGNTPAILSSTTDGTSSAGIVSYEWQMSTTGNYSDILGATASTYQPGSLTDTTSYQRRTVSTLGSTTCYSSYTTPVTINVVGNVLAGTVSGSQTICSGSAASGIHLSGHQGSIQWQSSTDNTNFTNIVGQTEPILATGALSTTTYYRAVVTFSGCSGYSTTGTVNVLSSGSWLGASGVTITPAMYNNASNWCGGVVPTSPTIPPGVTVYMDGSYDFTNVTIECGGSLIITSTGRVNITNVLTNNGTVHVINGGTIHYGTTAVGECPGVYEITQNFQPSRYWYVGPTTTNTVRTDFGSVASTNNQTGTQMWSWNETTNASNGYISPIYSSGTTLIPGKGYIYRNLGATTLDVNVTGPYITTPISQTGLTRTGTGVLAGYHLFSNPYTAYLDADDLFNNNSGTTNLVSSIWVRSNSTANGGAATMVFDTYNASSGIGTGLGWQTAALNGNPGGISNLMRWIAPMQGFWVRVNTTGSGSLAYNYNMAEANPVGAGQLRTTSPISGLARLNVNFGDQKDQMVAALSANATNGFEAFDSEKMFTSGVVQVYAPNSGKKLAINTLKNNKSKVSMPLTVECPGAGWYSFDLVELILENGVVFLEDKLNGEMKDLTIDSSYQFYANSGVLQNRFILHFHLPSAISNVTGPTAIEDLVSESQSATIDITSTGSGKVTVELDQVDEVTNSAVRICDLNGRVVDSFMADGKSFEFQINQGQGAYLIEVTNGLTVEKKKVFIQ